MDYQTKVNFLKKLFPDIQDKISADNFREDPMNVTIGQLHVAGCTIKMKYKDLIVYSKSIQEQAGKTRGSGKESVFSVDVKTYTVNLVPHEIQKLADTLHDSLTSCMRAYELGLYL